MAAKILHSLTENNPDLQKQIGCMTGIFQLFDRQPILACGRGIVGHSPKRLLPRNGHSSSGPLERDFSNSHSRSASLQDKYPAKNMQERQRVSTESSRASFSSSSRSSSFSSLDCNNRGTQLEPASYDRITFPETPSRDPTMSLQSTSPQFSRQSLDLKDLVKDSMYREIQGLSVKSKPIEEAKDSIQKHRPHSKNIDRDFKESLKCFPKLQDTTPPWYQNEPRELSRSLSYHSKDGSSFSVSKDAPRFSYDGREINRTPFGSSDVSKSSLKFKDPPRLSLESREGSMRSLNADSKSNFPSRTIQKDVSEFDGKIQDQAPPPSVVAKLMGLDTLPNSVSVIDTNTGSSRSFQESEFVNVPRPIAKIDTSKPVQQLSLSSNSWKEPSSPSWRNPDSSMKPMSRFPIEPAPWKQTEGARGVQKTALRSVRSPAKAQNTVSSVYSEIEKRLKDLKFTQSGKDLRALKQILEAMQDKGFLETEQEGQGLNYANHKEHDQELLSYGQNSRFVINRKPQTEQGLSSTKRRVGSARNYDSPILIMKPEKLVEKSGIPAASVISLDGFQKSLNAKSGQRDYAVSSVNTNTDRTVKSAQSSTKSQNLAKDSNGLGKNSNSTSPRLLQRKLELDKRARPPTPPDSSKSRRQSNKQWAESISPGGRRRSKYVNPQSNNDQLSDTELRWHENENLFRCNESVRRKSKRAEVSPSRSPSQSSSKAYEVMVSDLEEKNPGMALSEEESAEFAHVVLEYSSPVSVLDNVVHKDDSRSPVKYAGKSLQVDVSMDKHSDATQGSSTDNFVHSTESGSASEINRKKLQNVDNLVQKLRRLNSNHDEERTDYIASLCNNTDPNHRYISEILLASGLLLRDLSSSLSNFQFHPSGHPINPKLFLVLEQTKASSLLKEECSTEKTAQFMIQEKFHRKLVFDTVNEILARKLACSGPLKVLKKPINGQKLLREICSEIDGLQPKNMKYNSEEEDERWKNILCNDVMNHKSGSWVNFEDEISDAVLDIERMVFKDLVNEVIGEPAGLMIKSGKRRQIVSK